MQFIAALIEHFVVGVISLLWLMPVLYYLSLLPSVKISDHKEIILTVAVPVAYVVGMYVDVVASIITSMIRRIIDKGLSNWRKKIFGAHISGGGRSYERTVQIMKKSPEEATKYLLLLSGREKIARGVFTNVAIAAVLDSVLPKSIYSISPLLLLLVAMFGLFVWLRYNALTDLFKDQLL